MATDARARLLWLALPAFLLALVPAPAQAGTPDAPEITDETADQEVNGVVPIDPVIGSSADLAKAWITEEADALIVTIEVAGEAAEGTLGDYAWSFVATAAGTEIVATGASDGTAGGVASAVTLEGSLIVLTIPRDALAGATVLEGIHATSAGGSPADQVEVEDTAPDDGADAGLTYTVTGGGATGSPGDADGDGLNDTEEVRQFGNITLHNGTGDPDQDGLNNSREFALGTNATNADTDGDGLKDGEDPEPLVPAGGADAEDSDADGLNDTWEQEHFQGLAQNGSADPDDDGLNNTAELTLGTDPNDADTDGDGRDDGDDAAPLTPASSSTNGREAEPELYAGGLLFAVAATFVLLGLAKGI